MAVLSEPLGRNPASTYLKAAAVYARQSEHGIYKMGAVIVGKHWFVFGFNKNRTHPKAKNYTRKIHAELAAILQAARTWGTWDTDMYVVRITNSGAMATSKPCKDCWILLKEAGIRSVTFIDKDGKICTEKL
jgi:tRNA(Arg) A34 adenosine deaminase TadA